MKPFNVIRGITYHFQKYYTVQGLPITALFCRKMKMEAKRKEATRYKTDRVTGRVVEKEPGDPTIEEVSPIEAKFLARVS